MLIFLKTLLQLLYHRCNPQIPILCFFLSEWIRLFQIIVASQYVMVQ